MFRKSGPETIGAYARDYGLLRDLKPETLRQYQIAADLFERWAGGPVRLDELDERSVSEWLRDYAAKAAPNTVRSKKVQVVALWRAAAEDGLCDPPTKRVRAVKVPWRPPTAWDHDEVEQLLAACRGLKRWHRCGLRRSDWFDLAVRVAWDTGLRWGDLIRLPVASIRPDGSGAWCQSKTSRPVVFRLAPSTMAALRQSLATAPRDLVCPWPASHETFTDQVDRLVKRAGIREGTWKWIRRASSTDVESQQAGASTAHLGHVPGSKVAAQSYNDPAILGRQAPTPRELLVSALRREDRKKAGGGHSKNPPPDSVRRAG
jgi:integrase